MAGIVSGISHLVVGPCDARRRQTQPQSSPNAATNTTTPTPTRSTNTTTPTPTTPTPSEEQQFDCYWNAGKQNIKGLTNQTGYVKGNANGVINFGSLTASAGAQRQA